MAKELRVPQFLPGIPKFLMSLTLGGMHKLVYDSIYAKPQRLLSCGYPYKFLDITTCVADLIARN
jgi:NAD dependent epimerase/dehydratase family enzyme